MILSTHKRLRSGILDLGLQTAELSCPFLATRLRSLAWHARLASTHAWPIRPLCLQHMFEFFMTSCHQVADTLIRQALPDV